MIIRLGVQEDEPSVWSLICAVRRGMQEAGLEQWSDTYPTRLMVQQDVASDALYILESESGSIAAVMTLNQDEPIEYGRISWAIPAGSSLCVHRLAVHPRYRRLGYARILMQTAEECVRTRGLQAIHLDAYTKNVGASRLYPTLGYAARGPIQLDPNHADYMCFEKVLSRS